MQKGERVTGYTVDLRAARGDEERIESSLGVVTREMAEKHLRQARESDDFAYRLAEIRPVPTARYVQTEHGLWDNEQKRFV